MRFPWQARKSYTKTEPRTAAIEQLDRSHRPDSNPARNSRNVQRFYHAGEWSDLTADWPIAPTSSFQTIHANLNNLRARARLERKNNDYARKFIRLLKSGVVGPDGFKLRCQFEGRSANSMDEVANRAFEKHWKKWAGDPDNVDARGQLNFTEMLNQVVGSLPTEGEIILRWMQQGPMGYQLAVIDPYLLDVGYHDDLPNGNKVRFGVELSASGRAVNYFFNKQQNHYVTYYGGGDHEKVPAAEIYHVFLVEGFDQYRGIPWFATPMLRMHMLSGFEEASLINAREGANKAGVRKRSEPERYGDEPPTGNERDQVIESYAGQIIDVDQHTDWTTHDPTYPQGEFEVFAKQILRGVAAGLELVSYHSLTSDGSGVSYNTLRHDSLEERDSFMAIQNWIRDHLLLRIYRDWKNIQLLQPNGIPIPRRGGGFRAASILNSEKYDAATFQGRRWTWVDPRNEVDAQVKAVQQKFTTVSQIIREGGRDPEEVFTEWETDDERIGVTQQQPAGGSANVSSANGKSSDDDDAESGRSGSEDG